MVRKASYAGYFYPASRETLEGDLRRLIVKAEKKKRVLGLIVPHAGYIYSGGCAGKGFGSIELTSSVILLGVNHRGAGYRLAVDGHDYWETPLGRIAVDAELRSELTSGQYFQVDSQAGIFEHSLEVQVPFIQFLNPQARILPILVSSHQPVELLAAGRELARLLEKKERPMMVASSDMSHYISAEAAKKLDGLAIDRMLNLDAAGLISTVSENDISMCGVAPVTLMLAAAVTAGATQSALIEYTHSGAVTGDTAEVVGYASLIVF